MENFTEILNFSLPAIIGLVFGLVIAGFKKPKAKSILSGADNETKLENEVLQDRVKQLEAKIKTLERAIEMSN